MRTLHNFAQPCHFGPITALCLDRRHLWLVTGTSTGTLALWDLRFGLLLRSWSVGARRIHQVAIHPTKGKGRWIVVTASPAVDPVGDSGQKGRRSQVSSPVPVLEVWDIDQGAKVEEFCIVPPSSAGTQQEPLGDRTNNLQTGGDLDPMMMREATLDPAAAIEALLATSTDPKPPTFVARSSDPSPVMPTVRAIVLGSDYASSSGSRQPGTHVAVVEQDGRGDRNAGPREGRDGGGGGGAGFILTGGEDRKLRYWDLGKPSRSTVVSGLDAEGELPTYRYDCFLSLSLSRLESLLAQCGPYTFMLMLRLILRCSVHTNNGRFTRYLESATPLSDSPATSPPASRAGHRAGGAGTATSAGIAPAAAPVSRMHRSTLIATSQQRLARAHHEAITALGLLELPYRCVVTGDRSGIVRVYE